MIDQQNYQIAIRNFWIIISIISIVVVILLFCVYYIYEKNRKNKIAEETRNIERQRIARDMHDEIGAGLSKIIMLSNLMIKNKAENNDKVFMTISDNALRTSENIRELIWLFNVNDLTLRNLVMRIRKKVDDYLENTAILHSIEVDENLKDSDKIISKDICRHLIFILQELLQNTVKHANASEIKLNIICQRGDLQLMYFDNGKGYQPDDENNGHGMHNIKFRIHQMGGHLKINSDKNGTNFSIFIPTIFNL